MYLLKAVKNKSKLIAYILGIFIVSGIVFFPSLQNKFIWDDEAQIINNPYIRSLKNIPSFFTGGTFYLKGSEDRLQGIYYRPLMTFAYTITYHFFGLNPVAYHSLQLLIHTINTIFLFILFLRLIQWKNILIPFLLAVLFLIHPMNSETVSYIANLQDVLFFFFGIVSLHFIINKNNHIRNLIVTMFLFLLSLLSKETGLIFVTIAICYIYLFHKKNFKLYLFSYIIAVLFYAFIRCGIAHICVSGHKPNPVGDLPFLTYLLHIPALIFYYLKTFTVPINLAIGQSWTIKDFNWETFYFPIFVLFALSIYLLYLLFTFYIQNHKYKKLYVFFLSWFIFGLLFHMQVFPLDFTVTDRWFYVPMAGLVGLIWLLIEIYCTNKKSIWIAVTTLSIIIVIFSTMTYKRNFDWFDNYTIFSRDIKKTKGAFHLENNLGVEYYRKQRYDKAHLHFEKAAQYAPDWYTAWANLGTSYYRKKEYQKSEDAYKKAIQYGAFYQAYQNYIEVLEKQGKKKEALQFIEMKALKKFPKNKELLKTYTRLKNE